MTNEIASSKSGTALLQAMKNDLGNAARLREGEVVHVTLLAKTSRAAFFDLGNFGTGIVYGAELSSSREILKTLEIGQNVPARIEQVDGHMGYVELSLSEAGKQKSWIEVKALEESGEVVKVKVSGANQGGLIADLLGLKAFLPISQLANEHAPKNTDGDRAKSAEELKGLIGQEISVKVITVLPRANKLIVSERDSASSNATMKTALVKYEVGQIVPGVVSGIADFGIFVKFVDNPEIEGLVHISEIDHRIIDNPKETVKLGESVQVKLIDIRDGRVFLSLKALKNDPWLEASNLFKEGQEVSGKVYKFNPFGAIIDLEGGIQGLIHVSEFGGLDEMKKVIEIGQSYQFIIGSVKPEEKRLILKAKK
jgi:small subunit ribosomal protein S1